MDEQTNQKPPNNILNKKVLLTIFGIIILAEIIWAGWVFYKGQTPKSQQIIRQAKPTEIILRTDREQVKVGDEFSVAIAITSDKETDGADLIINYNSKLLSASPTALTSIYNDYPVNKVDAIVGKITVSGISTGTSGIVPNGLFGTITFKALAPGQAAITLDFVPSSTVDTNVIEKDSGKDVLESVKNLNIVITP